MIISQIKLFRYFCSSCFLQDFEDEILVRIVLKADYKHKSGYTNRLFDSFSIQWMWKVYPESFAFALLRLVIGPVTLKHSNAKLNSVTTRLRLWLVYRYTKEGNINELRHNSMYGYENKRNSLVYRYTRTAPRLLLSMVASEQFTCHLLSVGPLRNFSLRSDWPSSLITLVLSLIFLSQTTKLKSKVLSKVCGI